MDIIYEVWCNDNITFKVSDVVECRSLEEAKKVAEEWSLNTDTKGCEIVIEEVSRTTVARFKEGKEL